MTAPAEPTPGQIIDEIVHCDGTPEGVQRAAARIVSRYGTWADHLKARLAEVTRERDDAIVGRDSLSANIAEAFRIRSELAARDATIADLTRQLGEARDAILHEPILREFVDGVMVEAQHQRERWGTEHDAGKSPFDWFWLIGYLAQKGADAQLRGDLDKALHHTITTAAAIANWHAQILGHSNMRPGIEPPADATLRDAPPAPAEGGR